MQQANNNNNNNNNITVPETFDGLLSVTVCDAELKGQDLKESFDPYFKLSLGSSSLVQRLKEGETLGKERYTTQSKPHSGAHPVWNESHDFSIHNMKQDSHLKIRLFDRNVLKDKLIGLVKIDLSELVRNLSSQKQFYELLDKHSTSVGRIGIITKFVGMDLPVQNQVVQNQTKKEEVAASHVFHDQPQNISTSGVATGVAPGVAPGIAASTATGAATGIATREPTGRIHDQGFGIDRRDLETKEPTGHGDLRERSIDLGHSEKAYDRDERLPRDDRRHELKDELWKAPVDHSTRPGLTQEGIKEALKPDLFTTDRRRSSIDQSIDQEAAQPEVVRGNTFAENPVHTGVIREAGENVSYEQPGILEQGKQKLNQAAALGKEKLAEAAILAGPVYRQTMPEILGGGYPVKPATVIDGNGQVISNPTTMEKAKEVYRESMPEALGGRPATFEEKQQGTGTQKAQQMFEQGKAKLAEAAAVGQARLGEAAIIAGPTYRQTMPEVLGGGYPVKPAVIKDETGKVISDTHPEGIIQKAREYIPTVVPATMLPAALQPAELVNPAAGIVIDKSVAPALEQPLPMAQERLLGVDTSNSLLEKPLPMAQERLLYVVPATGPAPSMVAPVVEKVQSAFSGVPSALASVPSAVSGATQSAKGIYREYMPEVLGGRAPTLMEKVTQSPSLLGKVRTLAAETLPESLGGRPPTLTERLTAAPSLIHKAQILREETLPTALGGKPSLTEKARAAVEEVKENVIPESAQPSFFERAKEVITGKPTLTEKVTEKVHEIIPTTEVVETESTQPTESLLEKAKHTLKQTMPEALGGGYPVKAGVIRDEEGDLIKVVPAVVDERTGEIIPEETLMEKAKHTLKQTMPEVLGGGYPVPAATIRDIDGTILNPTSTQKLAALPAVAKETFAALPSKAREYMPAKETIAALPAKAKEYIPAAFVGGATESGPHETLLERAQHTLKQTMPEALGGGYPVQNAVIRDTNGTVLNPTPAQKLAALPAIAKEKLATLPTVAKEYMPTALGGHAVSSTESQPSETLLERAQHTYKQTMPEILGGGYPVKTAVIKDIDGTVLNASQTQTILEKGQEKFNQATVAVTETYLPQAQSLLEQGKGKLSEAAILGQEKLGQASVVGKEKFNQASILAGPTYRQTMPEALGGGYPVKAAVIKDTDGAVLNTSQTEGILERGKGMLNQTLGGVIGSKAPAEGFQTDLEEWRANQPSLADKAKQTFREVAPEALGGRPALEGERTFGMKAQEKLADIKENLPSLPASTTASISTTSAPTTSLLGRVKQTVAETIPIVKQTVAEKLPIVKQTLTETLPAIISGRPTTTMTTGGALEQPKEVITEEVPVITEAPEFKVRAFETEQPVQSLKVIEEVRKVDMDEAGHVTQIESFQNVHHVPVIIKDFPLTQETPIQKMEYTQKVEDIPINEQPVLADNYEFQGQSLPAPIQTRQKVNIPTPQIMTDDNNYTQQSTIFH